MSLKEKLEKIAAASAGKLPNDAKAVMKSSMEAVSRSIPARSIPGPGDPLPPFSLPDSQGQIVSSKDLVSEGPLVLTFFRGMW